MILARNIENPSDYDVAITWAAGIYRGAQAFIGEALDAVNARLPTCQLFPVFLFSGSKRGNNACTCNNYDGAAFVISIAHLRFLLVN